MRTVHLIANAHIDPMYMWRWDEGISEALATFRAAAEICEESEGFVFNHNEALLYEWTRRVDPALFARIQRLVKAGRWHIMGGWYVQPDCNLPSGESFVRQMLVGLGFFRKYFGVRPTTAINFDSFGHTRGLVQILKKAGFDSYIFCRPVNDEILKLPGDDFVWVGFDGSEIIGHRAGEHYNSEIGRAAEKVRRWLGQWESRSTHLFLWGVGNHGGGPSRRDLAELSKLEGELPGTRIIHSTPEAYFAELGEGRKELGRYAADLDPIAEGSYSNLALVKQKHRALENELFSAEKMLSCAAIQGLLEYPKAELEEALKDLLLGEFHDALAGSMVREAEEDTLQTLGHGLEIAARLKYRAFFALTAGQAKVKPTQSAMLVFNPHPHAVTGVFECEFGMPPDRKSLAALDLGGGDGDGGGAWDKIAWPIVHQDGKVIPSQLEKEHCHKPWDWRKRTVFRAELAPFSMNRFDCSFKMLAKWPERTVEAKDGAIRFKTEQLEVVINCATGLMDQLKVGGKEFVKPGACKPLVIEDGFDCYGWAVGSFAKVVGEFRLMTMDEVREYSGFRETTPQAVRIIEDGEVRTVVEALLVHGHSAICQRYMLPKHGEEIEIELRVHWLEKGRMLKLAIPTVLSAGKYLGQTAYGTNELPAAGQENYSHKWAGLFEERSALTWVNEGIYASSCDGGEIRVTLLRSPLYLGTDAHKTSGPPKDRTYLRSDQGERMFRLWIKAGEAMGRRESIDREALWHNERPYVLSLCPSGEGSAPKPLVVMDDAAIQLAAVKKAEESEGYVLRLFEPTGKERVARMQLPALGMEMEVRLAPYEVKTLLVDVKGREIREVGLMEEA